MKEYAFPTIDVVSTGVNIKAIRKRKGLSIKQIQAFCGFDTPRTVYKWESGECLPSTDHLVALSVILETPIDEIIVLINHGKANELAQPK